MRVIIIGKNETEYAFINKENLNKHFYISNGELYKIYPESAQPVDMYHDGAYVGTDSLVVFLENGTLPQKCQNPDEYKMDKVLASIDEHKLMLPHWEHKKGFWDGFKKIHLGKSLPYIIVALIVGYGLISQWVS